MVKFNLSNYLNLKNIIVKKKTEYIVVF
jgi:hypothetical protein